MMIILSRNFSLFISLVNQDKGRRTNGRRPSEWMKLKVARSGLIVQSVAERSTLKGRTHTSGTCSPQTCAPCLLRSIQLSWKKKKGSLITRKVNKKQPWKPICTETSAPFFVFSEAYALESGGSGSGCGGTGMLICEIMAFLGRIANCNMCHFVKRTAVVAADTVSRGLSPSLSVRDNGCQV